MNHFDDWLEHALEQRLGCFVEEKILAIQNLDSETLDSLGDELVHLVCRSQEMLEFRNNILHQDYDVLSLDGENNAPYDSILNDSVARGTSALSRCSSVNETPRKETGDDVFSVSERRAKISSQRSMNQRMQALELLLKVPISDIVGSANWPHLQQELCESLCDENCSVFMQVLRVLTRLSSSSLFSPVREGFLSVLEGLTLYYLTRNLHQQLPSTLHGVQLENPVHRRIVLTSQCLLQILYIIPGKWIRYGEKRTQEIVDNFVDLLSMHTHHHRTLTMDHSKDILYPFHMFSILDPEAKWCEGIMHAAFGRTILMKSIMKSSSLIRFIVEEVIIWLKCQMKLSEGATLVYECGTNGNMINLSVFIHCVSLLKMFINCERGHLLFPVLTSIQEEAVSVYSLLLKILEFLNRISSEPKMHHSERLQKLLENVCATLILSRGTRILQGSSIELIHQLMEVQHRTDHFSLHMHNVNILCKISESPIAVRWMLGRPARRTRDGLSRAFSDLRVSLSSASSSGRESVLTNRTACVARKIAKATTAAVRDRNRFTSESTSPAAMLLSLSERLFSTPEGYLLLESCEGQLIPSAGQLLMHIRNMMYNSDLGLLSMQQSLESFLIGMTLTPMGFLAVSSVEGLSNCLVACFIENPSIDRYNKPIFLHLFQLLTSVPNLKLQIHRKNLMKHALQELWSAQECISEWDWEEAKNRFTSIVLAICSTPTAIAEMLEESDQEDDSSESTLVEEIQPLSMREFFLSGLQSMCETGSGQMQEIFFKVLHLLSHNIDLALQLQENLKLSDCLQRVLTDAKVKDSCNDLTVLTVQPSPRKDKSNTNIVDEDARSCSHILTIIHQLRDPSPCKLSTWPNCGGQRSPRTHAYTSRARIQTDLQRFLQDTRHGLHDNMWISHARRAYRASCRSDLKVPVLMDLLDQVLHTHPALSTNETSLKWPTRNAYPSHSEQHQQAIEMVIRFGCQMKSLNANVMNTHVEQLALLLHQTQIFLARQKTDNNFDWFAASVFLMCAGNVDRSRGVLQRVALLPNGSFIWPMLSQNTVQLTASINQHLQGLLAEFLPKAYNALQGAGIPWWLVAERLTQQAFLPSIPLVQLPHMLAITALHSWEYNLYMHAAILAHIQPAVLEKSSSKSIQSLLMDLKLDNFHLGDYIPFMDKLAKLNRPYLVRDRIATATI